MNLDDLQRLRIKNIVVLHAGALGDCVLALHCIAAIRVFLGCSRVDMVARSPIAHLARPTIDTSFDFEDLPWHLAYAGDSQSDVQPLRSFLRNYDLVVSFLGDQSDIVCRRLGEMADAPVLALHPRPDSINAGEPAAAHVVAHWLNCLALPASHDARKARASLHVAQEHARQATGRFRHALGAESKPLAIVHPGSGGRTKNCPVETLEETARRLTDDGAAVAWMLGPTEMDWHGPSLTERLASIAPVIAEPTLQDAVACIAVAHTYIGNDAGMTHVAAAVGVPTIALFGPTDPRVWQPMGDQVTVIDFRAPDAAATVVTEVRRIADRHRRNGS